MKGDNLYLDQIRDSVRKVESYVRDFNKGQFIEDEKTQSAVILQLTLIGEIAKKISKETQKKFNVPWEKIIGFRNRAIHNYFEMNLDIVWDTVVMDIPVLKKSFKKLGAS